MTPLQPQPPRRTLAIISRLVPPEQRATWLREWDAEFAYYLRPGAVRAAGRGRAWTLTHLGAAARHALWLRRTSLRRTRTTGAPRLMSDFAGDLRYAIRGCLRAPAFSLTVVLTLAVGLGLASAIFAFADGYLFRPLPFPGGDRTFYVHDTDSMIGAGLRSADAAVLRNSPLAGLGFVEWGIARAIGGQLVIDDRHIEVLPYEVSPGFRGILRLPLVAGRDFTPEDHAEHAPLVCWLSDRFWQREFGSSRDAIGRTYRVESSGGAAHDVRVVGILGPEVASFDLNNPPPDLVVPQQGAPLVGPNRFAFPLVLLPPDMTAPQAAQRIAAALQAGAPAAKPRTIKLSSLESSQLAGGKPTARLFFAGALLVLILASMNLVHLLLSRSTARAPEVATRAALGASRWRVIRLFLSESLVLGTIGIGAGLALGKMLSAVIASRVPQFPTAGRNLSMVPMLFDGRVIGFAIAMGLIVTVVGGLWPGWRALRRSMHVGGRSSAGLSGPVSHRLARIMLASELSVATIVLVGAIFMGLGIYRYLAQPVGFDYVDRLAVGVSASDGKPLPGPDLETVVRVIRSMPGVAAAGLDSVPVSRAVIEVPGAAIDPKDSRSNRVPPGFARAWGVTPIQGRWFEDAEFNRAADDVVVIDARMARMGWPDANPVGASLRVAGVTRQIIGVVPSRRSMLDGEPAPTIYTPMRESDARGPVTVWAPGWSSSDLSTRLAATVGAAVSGARVTVVPVSFDRLFARSAGEAQFQAPVMGAFGILAIVVAAVGVFGLVSYLVEQRRREFGIRMALGARRADVWRAVVRESLQPAAIGLGAGALGAWALESVVRSSVFGWPASGWLSLAIVAAGLFIVATVAALIPAARAARIDPAVTLKSE